ncbi:DUF3486 family protein [Alkalimonas mucilaginosa]|uniref:DUF3486 family protein n=1 Tax=Alkalimonas mucilaginosa TaxID=3057676 RepID=A0ABU7JHZ6_9GAMM|nr:DUF3486 family protein [Alkalimonas sp. MEB004]MEE2025041.1 DUF3486 family protein [Alkalimonas sp. MEB004]
MSLHQAKAKNRRSKVELLPADIKAQLNEMLRDGRMQQIEIVEAINQLIESKGLPEDQQLSKSGLNRYAKRMEDIGQRIRQAREVAEVWTAKLGNAPVSDLGKILQEGIRALAFETQMDMAEGKISADPKSLNQMALLCQRIEAAAMSSHKREKEMRQLFASEAAEVAEKVASQQGLTAEGVAALKREILGIA